MMHGKLAEFELLQEQPAESALDLVVPFTTMELTRVAMDCASALGAGLTATVRLIRVQPVPYPMDLTQSPVVPEFIGKQLEQFPSTLPVKTEILLTRDFGRGLLAALRQESVVVIGYRKRFWRTYNERMAARLRRAGHNVLLVPQELISQKD